MIRRIVSGGQTGVDRAALDAALHYGIPCGGWCPRNRFAEDGMIPPQYPLIETPTMEYAQRTHWNVRDSDGTLVLTHGPASGGTALTIQLALQEGKRLLVLDLARAPEPQRVAEWASRWSLETLNVAGPRESTCPGIYQKALAFLHVCLDSMTESERLSTSARPNAAVE